MMRFSDENLQLLLPGNKAYKRHIQIQLKKMPNFDLKEYTNPKDPEYSPAPCSLFCFSIFLMGWPAKGIASENKYHSGLPPPAKGPKY